MYIFQVHHYIKPDQIEAYKAATLENARKTLQEPGHFSLLEIYSDLGVRNTHLETEHFKKWVDVYLRTQDHKGSGDEFIALFPEASL